MRLRQTTSLVFAAILLASPACHMCAISHTECHTDEDCPPCHVCDRAARFCYYAARVCPTDLSMFGADSGRVDALSQGEGGADGGWTEGGPPPDGAGRDRTAREGGDGESTPRDTASEDAGSFDAATDAVVEDAEARGDVALAADASGADSVTASHDGGLSLLFLDEFESLTPGRYDTFQGTWVTTGGALRQQQVCGTCNITVAQSTYQDVSAEADIRVDEVCGNGYKQVGVAVRYRSYSASCDTNQLYLCAIDFDGRLLHNATFYQECVSHRYTSALTPALATGTWYHLRAIALGSTLRCELSGGDLADTVELSRDDSTISDGTIGVQASSLAVSIDDLLVSLP